MNYRYCHSHNLSKHNIRTARAILGQTTNQQRQNKNKILDNNDLWLCQGSIRNVKKCSDESLAVTGGLSFLGLDRAVHLLEHDGQSTMLLLHLLEVALQLLCVFVFLCLKRVCCNLCGLLECRWQSSRFAARGLHPLVLRDQRPEQSKDGTMIIECTLECQVGVVQD